MDTAIQSSLSQLPHELLAKIFLHYLDPHYLETVVHSKSCPTPNLPSPLLLGQICSTWRRVAHGTPKLWTSFSFGVKNEVMRGKVGHVSFAKAWLSRAQPYPLYVLLGIYTPLSHITYVILPSADRLQAIRLHLPFPHFQSLVNLGSIALLESVYLSVDVSHYGQEAALWPRRITAFTTAPRLRSVTFWCYRVGLFGCGVQMPWSQLTKLHIREYHVSADACCDAFLKCTNLVDCALDMHAWQHNFMTSPRIVVLPHLQKLDVTFRGPGHSFPFFQPLNLPALKDLTVATSGGCVWSHEIFMEFTFRSSLDLEHLCIEKVTLYSDELLHFLPHMYSLVELEVELSWCIDDNLFDALYYRAMNGQHIVPQLKTLRIFGHTGGHIDDNGIANMIESRWWTDDAPRAVSRLQRVDVAFDDREIDAVVRERLERCRREGLDLTLG